MIAKTDRARRIARYEVDIMLRVIVDGLQEKPLGLQLALQIRLRQRRPLIGRRRLIANQRDLAGKASKSQRIGRLPARLARADDHNALWGA